jgi:adenylate kinase family enzyme
VLGPCGAGKSWLAIRLGAALGLPVIPSRQGILAAGWVEPAEDQWAARVEELIARPRWVMDGKLRRFARPQARNARSSWSTWITRAACSFRACCGAC